MTRATIVLPLLAFLLVACSTTEPDPSEPQTVTTEAGTEERTDIGEAASDEDAPSDAENERADTAASESDEDDEGPTPDPTVMAVAAAFEMPIRGNPDSAKLTIYEFSDYMCPYCAKFAKETLPELVSEYVETGEVALIFVDFPLQSHGYPALMSSEAAHCAGEQGSYWQMHDAIFDSQSRLALLVSEQEESVVAEELQEVAEEAGLDGKAIRACLDDRKYRPIVGSLFNQAMQSGVNATPTLLIGEQAVPGFLPFEDLEPIIEQELANPGASSPDGS